MPTAAAQASQGDVIPVSAKPSAAQLADLQIPAHNHLSGWEYRKKDSSESWVPFTFGTTTMPGYDISIRPTWKTDQYKVSYDLNGASAWGSKPDDHDYDFGSKITPEPNTSDLTPPAHQQFDAWEYSQDDGSTWNPFTFGTTPIPDHDIIIHPTWMSAGCAIGRNTITKCFPDTGLAAAVAARNSTTVSATFTQTMVDATTDLNAANRSVTNLEGIQYLTKMTHLNLVENTDLSDLGKLSDLTALKQLELTDDNVTDLRPLRGLTGLTNLNLMHNRNLSDLSPLGGLTGLTWLNLSQNSITSTSDLSNLTALTYLNLGSNSDLSDISGLSNLTSLQSLVLSGDKISNVSALENLAALTSLNLGDNKIADISALSGLNALQVLNLSNNEVSSVSELGGLTTLTTLNLSNNKISSVSDLGSLSSLTVLNLNNNKILDVSTLGQLASLSNFSATGQTPELPKVYRYFGDSNLDSKLPYATDRDGSGIDLTGTAPAGGFDYAGGAGGYWWWDFVSSVSALPFYTGITDYTGSFASSDGKFTGTVKRPVGRVPRVYLNENGGVLAAPGKTALPADATSKKATAPSDPTRENYTFEGWHKGSVSGDTFSFDDELSDDTAVVAKWSPKPYLVSYDADDGTWDGAAPTADRHAYNSTIASAPSTAISRTGYTQNGWQYHKTGSMDGWETFTFGITTVPGYDITIRPKWEIKSYNLSYDVDQGSWPGTPPTGGLVVYNTKIASAPDAPSRTGYTQDGWQYHKTGSMDDWETFTFGTTTVPAYDFTIRPNWKVNHHDVSFDADGGLPVPGGQTGVAYGSTAVSQPPAPSKTGYTLAGWKWQPTGSGSWEHWMFGTTAMPDRDVTLVADWTVQSYTVTYDPMNGSDVTSRPTNFDAAFPMVADPSKTGYTFRAWQYEASIGVWRDYAFPARMPAEDVTLHASYTPNPYRVSYDVDQGSWTGSAPVDGPVDFGSTIASSSAPSASREGYTQHGWQYRKTDSSDSWGTFVFGITTIPAYAITIRPNWQVNSYNVTYDKDGGSWTGVPPVNGPVEYGSAVSPEPGVSREGYTRQGWQYRKTDSNDSWGAFLFGSTTVPAYGITIRPDWKANHHNVTYVLNGGVGGSAPAGPDRHDYGTKLTKPVTSPTRTGYEFGAWQWQPAGSGPWADWDFDSDSMPDHDVVLQAKWTPKNYQVHYDLNSGTGTLPGDARHDFDSRLLSEPDHPTRTGYAFGSWEYSTDNVNWNPFSYGSAGTTIPASNITIRPKWTPNSHQVTYDVAGGTWNGTPPADGPHDYDSTLSPEPLYPSKSGYTCMGWEYKKTGSSDDWATFTFGVPSVGTTMPDYAITIRPKWTPNSYTVHYDLNGATGGTLPDDKNYNFGSTIETEPDHPTLDHHSVVGWEYTKNGTDWFPFLYGSVGSGTPIPNGNITIHPKWQLNHHTVTYDADEGSWTGTPPTDGPVDYGTVIAPVPAPEVSRTGYTQDGWQYRRTDSSDSWAAFVFGSTLMPDYAVTVRPNWKVDHHDILFDAVHGSPVPASMTDVAYGTTALTAPAEPSRTGYDFKGWQYEAIAGDDNSWTDWEFGTTAMPDHDVTLKAHWKAKLYHVTFDQDPNYVWPGGAPPSDGWYEYDTTISTEPAHPSRKGSRFVGWMSWQTSGGGARREFKFGPEGVGTYIPAYNFEIRPKWEFVSYQVTYDVDGGTWTGTPPVDGPVEYTSIFYQEPNAPSKTGYTQDGWQYRKTGSSDDWQKLEFFDLYNPGTTRMPDYPITIRPKWQPNHHTVHYDLDNGTGTLPGDAEHNYGSVVASLPEPGVSREGYSRQGWLYRKTDSSDSWGAFVFGSTTMPDYAITIRPNWRVRSYNLSYDADEGLWPGVAPSGGSVVYGSTVAVSSAPAAPSRTGYTQHGWQYRKTGSLDDWESFVFGSTTVPAYDFTVRPRWTPNHHRVSYDAAGGAWTASPLPVDGPVDYGSTIVRAPAPATSRAGYTQHGWQYCKTGSLDEWGAFVFGVAGTGTAMPDYDITIRPHWMPNRHTVEFDAAGGAWPGAAPSMIARQPYGAAVSPEPAHPSREGYTQDGWQYRMVGSTDDWEAFVFGSTPMPDYGIVVRPDWEVNHHALSYERNGGSVLPSGGSTAYGTALSAPPAPTREGHEFAAWEHSTDHGATWSPGFPSSMPDSDLSVRPTWTVKNYRVSYDAAGGSWTGVPPVDGPVAYGSAVSPEPGVSREGYSRQGWLYRRTGSSDSWGAFVFGATTVPAYAITVRPDWKANHHDVSFDANGGSPDPAPQTGVAYGSTAVSRPAAPSRAGYFLAGWQYQETPGSGPWADWDFGVTTMPDHDVALRAHWTANPHSVTYDPVDGSSASVRTTGFGEAFPRVADPVRTGYAFRAWQYEASPGDWEDYAFPATMPDADLVLHARWDVNHHALSYERNGGSVLPSGGSTAYGTALSAPPAPTREGHEFAAWEHSTDHGATWSPGFPSSMPDSDLSVRPTWTVKNYNVSYDAAGGSWTGVPPVDGPVAYGSAVSASSAPSASREGYTQDGWLYRRTGSSDSWGAFVFGATTVPAYAITVRPDWKANHHQVTYVLNGGVGGSAPAGPDRHDYGTKLTKPVTSPTRTGYEFGSWQWQPAGSGPWADWDFDSDIMPDRDVVLQARWTPNHHRVSYDAAGGAWTASPLPVDGPVDYGSTIVRAPAPATSRAGYTQHGWQYRKTGSLDEWGAFVFGVAGTGTAMPDYDITIRPHWMPNRHTVEFDAAGGAWPGAAPSMIARQPYGAAVSPEPAHPSREGYTQDGWQYRMVGSTDDWEAFVFGSTPMPDYGIVVRPDWEVNHHALSYERNGGSVLPSGGSTAYGTALSAPPAPTREGHEFAAWEHSTDHGATWSPGFPSSMPDSDLSVRPTWTVKNYRVSYDAAGGSWTGVPPVDGPVAYGSAVSPEPGVSREGYSRQGWLYRRTGSSDSWGAFVFGATTVPAYAITVRPDWKANHHDVSFDANGGSPDPAPQTGVAYGSTAVSRPAAPSRAGYFLAGWQYQETPGSGPWADWDFGVTTMPDHDVALRAHWTANPHSVTYDPVDGSSASVRTTGFGEAFPRVADPVRTGYAFRAWQYEASPGDWEDYAFPATMPDADLVLHARWDVNHHALSYERNGGSVLPSGGSTAYGTALSAPPAPTREGHEFAAWEHSTDHGATWSPGFPSSMPDSDLSVRPTWTVKNYNVSYDAAGGSWTGVPPVDGPVAYGSAVSASSAPSASREGYTQDGWLYRRTGSSDSWGAFVFGATTVPAYAITVRPDWKANHHQVTYVLNGGVGGSAPAGPDRHDYGTKLTKPVTSPTRTGYEFGSWQWQPAGSGPWADWDFDSDIMPDRDVVLQARWTPNHHRVSYDAAGGAWTASPLPVDGPVDYGSTIVRAPAPATSRAGYTQHGWQYCKTGSLDEWGAFVFGVAGTGTAMPDYDITIRPHWMPNRHTVEFDAAGGAWPGAAPSMIARQPYGAAVSPEPAHPSREGYTQDGWQYRMVGSTDDWEAFVFGSTPMPDYGIVVRPDWEVNHHALSYERNGGSVLPSGGSTAYGTALSAPPAPTREGHEFAAWEHSTDHGATWSPGFPSSMPDSDLSVRPTWTVKNYRVSYDAAGGSWTGVPPVDGPVAYGSAVSPEPGVSREGYSRQGWLYRRTGSSDSWGAFVFGATTVPAYAITVRPDWKANHHDVSFDANGGSPDPAPQTGVAYGSTAVSRPAAPSRAGYFLAGWQYQETPGSGPWADWDFGVTTMPDHDVALRAHWTANPHSVTYDPVDGSSASVRTTGFGEAFPRVADPVRTGYAFRAWQYEASPGDWEDYAFPATMPDADLVLHARWDVNHHALSYERNGGSVLPSGGSTAYGTALSAPPAPTREGHEFAAWEHSTDHGATWSPGFPSSMPDSDLSVRPTWTVKNYNVSYDAAGGSWTGVPPVDGPVAYGSAVSASSAPSASREGYTQDGWLYRRTGSSDSWGAFVFGATTVPAYAITVRPDWKANHHQVTYVLNGGVGGSAPAGPDRHDYGTKLTKPVTSPTRTGYEFGSWQWQPAGSGPWADWDFDSDIMPDRDVVLQARWTPNHHRVSYDAAGGAWTASPLPVDGPVDYGSTIVRAPAPATSRAGYTQHGWQYRKTGSLDEWGAFVFGVAGTGTAMPDYDITIRPHWMPNRHTVEFDAAGGAWPGAAPSMIARQPYGAAVSPEPAHPSREGYTQDGWQYRMVGSTDDWEAFVFGSTPMPDYGIVVRPDWEVNHHALSYERNGGSVLPSGGSTAYGTALSAPPAPTREGHEFAAWEHSTDHGATWSPGFPSSMPDSDLSVRPTWTVKNYRVSYDAAGGSWTGVPPVDGPVAYGSAVSPEPGVSREGYSRQGWLYRRTGSSDSWGAFVFGATTVPAYAITVRPDWKARNYNVSYDVNGGSALPASTPKPYGSQLREPDHPTREGYTFASWQSSVDNGSTWAEWNFAADRVPAQNLLIRPTWTPINYTITYDGHGGIPSTSTDHADYDTQLTPPTDPSRTGYTFRKWQYQVTPGSGPWVDWDFSIMRVPAHNLKLRADWTPNPYNVTYELAGGAGPSVPSGPVAHSYGTRLTEPAHPTKTGYTFTGWQYQVTPGSGPWTDWRFDTMTVPDHDVTLKAHWTIKSYTVTFDGHGGTPATSTDHVEYNTAVSRPTRPTREGYTFREWQYQVTPGSGPWTDYVFTTPVTDDLTLRADWTVHSHNVTYDLNTGTGGSAPVGAVPHNYGTRLVKPVTNPTKPGYDFVNWQYEITPGRWAEWNFGSTTIPDHDVTLKASWTRIMHTVTFNPANGSAATSVPVGDGDPVSSPTDPTRTHYSFDYWTADGSTSYVFTTPVTHNITLTAKWTRIVRTVRFDVQGGSPAPTSPITVNDGDKINSEPAEPAKNDYAFKGWLTDGVGGTHRFDFSTPITSNLTLTAKWVPLITITIDVEGGEAIPSRRVPLGDPLGPLPTPVRSGYRFDGWFMESLVRSWVPYDPAALAVSDVTVVAHWTKTQFTEPPSFGWLETLEGHNWLNTPKGHKWLGTNPGHAWLGTSDGHAWLETPEGQGWVSNPSDTGWLHGSSDTSWLGSSFGDEWLGTAPGQAWLGSSVGKAWLDTPDGIAWISNSSKTAWVHGQSGHAWLGTSFGWDWLDMSAGRTWLGTAAGQAWLDTTDGIAWLNSHRGLSWLSDPSGTAWVAGQSGHAWLDTSFGWAWLDTTAGWAWLDTPAGGSWLHTLSAGRWLISPGGQRWLNVHRKRKTVASTGAEVAAPMGVMVSMLVLAIGLEIIRRRRYDD
ncbi:InlB B-repeat-containing protein [Bifidobacterium sp. ESL0775]|uniref:InlB B-repeat-containing protein n=1 Tax=Bifidobacterium sp. ESL0775 TaxID=2983230 RepID=UPI0023F8DDE5|nr:InlB B-repeat-containing protein [Bifidobacterium sp. ESL0775]WEV69495.1 InlB B-repeat-containing protein [Bifidobacterium sp. ESL0775]